MTEPFIGEIRMFSFDFAPKYWALCNGATMMIRQYTALYSLLGTRYGGDGNTTFKLPDLQGRVPLDFGKLQSGSTYPIGAAGGLETVTLNQTEMPAHDHGLTAYASPADKKSEMNNILAQPASPHPIYYQQGGTLAVLNGQSLDHAGGGQFHDNLQPFLVINFCIALMGYYPPRQ
jgi:microcystin-dependent protein